MFEFFIDLYADEDNGIEAQDEVEIVEVAPNRFKTSFHVPQWVCDYTFPHTHVVENNMIFF